MNTKPARHRRSGTNVPPRRPDIVIRSSEGTLVGEVKTIKDKVSAEQAIAQLLKYSRRTGPAAKA